MHLRASQQAVKQASQATAAALSSFGSDVADASRVLVRDAPAVARRVQEDLGNAVLGVHNYLRDAGATAGKGLGHATQQVRFCHDRLLITCSLWLLIALSHSHGT